MFIRRDCFRTTSTLALTSSVCFTALLADVVAWSDASTARRDFVIAADESPNARCALALAAPASSLNEPITFSESLSFCKLYGYAEISAITATAKHTNPIRSKFLARGLFSSTWAWNGKAKTWTQLFPQHNPSPRVTALTYDKLYRYVLLFGGYNAMGDCCSTTYNDTWIWDGVDWTQAQPSDVPPARTYPALVYDPNLNGTLLFGGYETPGEGYSDTWLFTGGDWTLLNPHLTPGGRWAMGNDFDMNIQAPLLFGGEITGDPFSNQSWTFTYLPVR